MNSKKFNFAIQEDKLLHHIVSKEGIKIYPKRVASIKKIDIRTKEIQSFLGRVNFFRRFIPNFAEILKHITNMSKKDIEIKLKSKARQSFIDIKKELTEATVLVSLDFTKDFLIFSFAS